MHSVLILGDGSDATLLDGWGDPMICVDEVESYFAGDERIMDLSNLQPDEEPQEIFEFHNKPETVVSSSEVFVQKQNAPQSLCGVCVCVLWYVCVLCLCYVLCDVLCCILCLCVVKKI